MRVVLGPPQEAAEEPAPLRPDGHLPARAGREPTPVRAGRRGRPATSRRGDTAPRGTPRRPRGARAAHGSRRSSTWLKCCDFGAVPCATRADLRVTIASGRRLGLPRPGTCREAARPVSSRPSRLRMRSLSSPMKWRSPGEARIATTTAPRPASANAIERPEADLAADEPRDALRVDEDLPHLQPRHERRGHPGAVALEELDQVEVRADGDDQLGALLVGEQQRDVLADPGRGDRAERRAPSRSSARRARARRRRGRRGRRARRRERSASSETESMSPTITSRPDARLEQRVGAAVDADEHRLERRGRTGGRCARSRLCPGPRATTSACRSRKRVSSAGKSMPSASSAPLVAEVAERVLGERPRAPRSRAPRCSASARLELARLERPARREAGAVAEDARAAHGELLAVARPRRRAARRARRSAARRRARAAAGPGSGSGRSATSPR